MLDPAARINNKTVQEILAHWATDLDRHVSSFLDQSLLLQQWDEQLLLNADAIAAIQAQAADIQAKQAAINRAIDVCDSEQTQLNAHLDQLEHTLAALPALTTADDNVGRRETYQLAEEVDAHLCTLSSTLGQTIAQLNERVGGVRGRGGASGGEAGGVGAGVMAQLTDILNVHLQSLQWLEEEAEAMELAVQRTSQQGAAAVHVGRDVRDSGRGIHGANGGLLMGARAVGRY